MHLDLLSIPQSGGKNVKTFSCCCCCFTQHNLMYVIQRIIALATEETTVTQQVSHRPIKCQSRLWSQRGTKEGQRVTSWWIQIATKGYATLQQAIWHRSISKRSIKLPYSIISRASSIDSDFCCRHPRPAFSATKRTGYAPTSYHNNIDNSTYSVVASSCS